MKHIRVYNDVTEQQNDFTRPIVYILKTNPTEPVLSKELTLVKSLEITFTSKTTSSVVQEGVRYSYQYSHDGNMLSQSISSRYNDKKLLLVVTVGNESHEYFVTYKYINTSSNKNANWTYKLISNDFYIYYHYYETNSGDTEHTERSFASNINYQTNVPITMSLYAG